ncbi:mechanosensitive ion channel [Deinococcus sp. SDU3-2]|uniref:Mechanosensitive ion channel n=1 Tax=Deinococcus terrestris TaxID=2651870 RepID=A0A7X1TRS5_9DEIO|nr:mechanosensitive ion channel domain-containing protein [Deinococcus terrestris]MPY67045.1 mechanosensitive ion channel [Deinococcus terrestris]
MSVGGLSPGLTLVWERAVGIARSLVAALPNIVVALLVFGLFWLLSRVLVGLLKRVLRRAGQSPYVGRALGQVVEVVVLAVGVLVAATIIFPTLNAATLFGTLGFTSVAIGFAFKDIFQNLLAGLLILITRPFRIGDQIISGATEGTVEDIQVRATVVRTYDNRKVVIPNSDLFTGRVTVNTAFEKRSVSLPLTLPHGTDLEQARTLLVGAARGVPDLAEDPPPSVVLTDLNSGGLTLSLRYWVSPTQRREVTATTDEVLTAVHARLREAGVNLAPPPGVALEGVPGRPLRVQVEGGAGEASGMLAAQD